MAPTRITGMKDSGIALYLHVPFCRRKCNYCSFVSYDNREADISRYVSALKQELALQAAGQRVWTIYLGGGTPSLLSPQQIEDVLLTVRSFFIVDDAAEVTMEANPGTVDEVYLTAIRESGVNRLSLGVQSLKDSELAQLGRIHTAAEARDAVRFARSSGFNNLSIDLIYGLPGGRLGTWRETLRDALDLRPEHISLYPLTVEDGTPLSLAIARGDVPAPNPDVAADQYELAEDLLDSSGYLHYEISNWAKLGYECRHNLVYWHCLPYLGVGVAAHSYLNGHRYANTRDLNRYMDALSYNALPPRDLDEEINPDLQLAEAIILGLRLTEGVSSDDIRTRFDIDLLSEYRVQIHELATLGLLEYDGQYLRLTRRGRLLGNQVFERFLPREL